MSYGMLDEASLGDPVRTGDWIAFFDLALRDRPWRDVLAIWWPRLLPGIAAGATHGVIRVGHAVRALRDGETGPRVAELGQGLAYWAARWQPLAPAGAGPYRSSSPRAALDAVPRVPDQRFGIRNRLAQLAGMPGRSGPVPGAGTVDSRLAGIVTAAVLRYGTHGHGNPIMMVHAATAPAAVLRTLPALPLSLHRPSLDAACAATAAVTAAYSPAGPSPAPVSPASPDEVMSRAVASGDPHAIKFADAAMNANSVTPDPALLAAAVHASTLIE